MNIPILYLYKVYITMTANIIMIIYLAPVNKKFIIAFDVVSCYIVENTETVDMNNYVILQVHYGTGQTAGDTGQFYKGRLL